MGRYKRRHKGRSRRRSWRSNQAALEHIRAYRELAERLGPIVDDIREAFFSLRPDDLQTLLQEYKQHYGASAYGYARKTYSDWKRGRVKLSGQTAERLLKLVPPFLSTDQRFAMVEKLCEHHAEQKSKHVKINLADPSDGVQELREIASELAQVPTMKHLPSHVMHTVEWLHDNDVVAARALLSEIDARKNSNSLKYVDEEIQRVTRMAQQSDRMRVSQQIDLAGGTIYISFTRPRKTLWQRFVRFIG